MAKRKKTHYAVAKGNQTGIFLTWNDCRKQTNGYPGAIFKGFFSEAAAQAYLHAYHGIIGHVVRSVVSPEAASDVPSSSTYAATITTTTTTGTTSSNRENLQRFSVAPSRACSASNNNELVVVSLLSDDDDETDATSYRAKRHRVTAASPIASFASNNKVVSLLSGDETGPSFKFCKASDVYSNQKPASSKSNTNHTHTSDSIPSSIYSPLAHKLMAKMGYIVGEGLGARKQKGIVYPIKASRQIGKSGIGAHRALNEKQRTVLQSVQRGYNVFVTGPAGTGKSVVLKHVIKLLKETYQPQEWTVVAPTGIAATALGGQTIHSFSGVGIPTVVADFEKAWGKGRKGGIGGSCERWRDLKALIVDEVSMLSGEFFDRLSGVVSAIKKKPDKVFGGLQLILCGDFLQLPPIVKKAYVFKSYMVNNSVEEKDIFRNQGFAFQAEGWQKATLTTIQLDEVFRQKNIDFTKVLHEIRIGKVSPSSLAYLKQCDRTLPPNKYGVKPTILYSTNKRVDETNQNSLDKLPGEEYCYQAKDSVEVALSVPDNYVDDATQELWDSDFFQKCIAAKQLRLKEGAQVMLIQNESANGMTDMDRPRLVNGSRGKVIGFAEMDSDTNAEYLSDSEIEGLMTAAKKGDSKSEKVYYPIVQFKCGTKRVIVLKVFDAKIVGLGVCTREAVPLKLAWAITIHKSQGLTLDYVVANVSGVFAEAQTYVALSRATDREGLELRGFSASKVRANLKALKFYEDPDAKFPFWNES